MKKPFCSLLALSILLALPGCPSVEVIRYEVADVAVEPPLQVAHAKKKDGEREKFEWSVSSGDGRFLACNPSASLAIDGKRFYASLNMTIRGKEDLRISINDWALYDKSNSRTRINSIHIQERTEAESKHKDYRIGKNWPDSIELKPGEYALGFSAVFDTPNFSSGFLARIVTIESGELRSIDWKFMVTEQARHKHKRKFLIKTTE